MSLATWKAEFYPVMAQEVRGKKAAIKHSLRKWRGLTRANLTKHGLVKQCGRIVQPNDELYVTITYDSCALCSLYLNRRRDEPCKLCPIFKLKGRDCEPQFRRFESDGNPAPMIRLLEQVARANGIENP